MGVVCDAAVPPLLVGWGALNKRMNHEEHEGTKKTKDVFLSARPPSCSSCPSWWEISKILVIIGNPLSWGFCLMWHCHPRHRSDSGESHPSKKGVTGVTL